MKRLLLLLGCIAAFSSCLKNDRFNQNQTSTGFSIYWAAYRQNVLTLDPSNVAFRLSILIAEGNGDFNAAPDAIKRKLVSPGTVITYDATSGVYTLTYNASTITGDFSRKGKILIETNGYATLHTPNATWNIHITDPYEVFSGDATIKMKSNSYAINNVGLDTWMVSVSQFVSQVPIVSNGVTLEYKSDWSATYTITQHGTGQTLAAMQKSIFSLTTSVMNGKTMYLPNDAMSVSTPIPFQYNPNCSTTTPVGDGSMLIFISSDLNMENTTEAKLLGGDQLNVCNPKTRISYGGYQGEYQIQ